MLVTASDEFILRTLLVELSINELETFSSLVNKQYTKLLHSFCFLEIVFSSVSDKINLHTEQEVLSLERIAGWLTVYFLL